MAFTLDSLVKDLLKDKRAVEVVEKYAPGITKNPLIMLVKGKSLKSLLDLKQAKSAGITLEMVQNLLKEINEKK